MEVRLTTGLDAIKLVVGGCIGMLRFARTPFAEHNAPTMREERRSMSACRIEVSEECLAKRLCLAAVQPHETAQ